VGEFDHPQAVQGLVVRLQVNAQLVNTVNTPV
jgi:hypothetical protein